MRPIFLLAVLVSVTVAFNVFRDAVVPDEQFLSVHRTTRDADSSDSSDSDEKDSKVTDGSGSGDKDDEEQLQRVVRSIEGSGEGSGFEVTSVPVRFVRSADAEGSGSGDVVEKSDE